MGMVSKSEMKIEIFNIESIHKINKKLFGACPDDQQVIYEPVPTQYIV